MCAAAHSLGVIGLTEFLPVPAETQRPALISKEPLQIVEVAELQTADEDCNNINSNTDPNIIPISFSEMAAVPQTQRLYPGPAPGDTQDLSPAKAQSQDQHHSAGVKIQVHNNPGNGETMSKLQQSPVAANVSLPMSSDHQTCFPPSLVFSSPGSGQKQPSAEEGLISQEETDQATQFLSLLQAENCGLQGETILTVCMAGAGQPQPSFLSSPSLGGLDPGPGEGGGGAGLSAAGDEVMMEADDGVMMEADYTVNSNTDPNIIPVSFSDSVVAGPGDMAAVRQTQQLYPSATDSGEQYRIIPEILSDGTFHEEAIDSCFSLFPGPGPTPGDTQDLRPATAQSQDHQHHHAAGVKTPVHNNLGHLHHGHGKTKQQQSPVAADVSLPTSGDHQEDASTELVVANSAAELPKSAVSCPSLVSSPGSSQNHEPPAEKPLDSTVISSQDGPFVKLVRGKINWDFGLHPEGVSETMVCGRHGPENHEDLAEKPLDSTVISSQNKTFVKLVMGKMCWDFGGEERFQKKDGHSEISKTAEIQTEETRIQRGKRSPYTTEEIEEGLKLLLSSTRTYKLLLQKQKETGSITLRLPSIQTCRLKIKGFKCPPGLNPEMLFLMEKKFDSLSCPEDKNCVLSCDEMDLNKKWSYDQRLKRLFPPHKVTMNKYVFKITISLSLFRKSKSANYED